MAAVAPIASGPDYRPTSRSRRFDVLKAAGYVGSTVEAALRIRHLQRRPDDGADRTSTLQELETPPRRSSGGRFLRLRSMPHGALAPDGAEEA